MGFLGLLALAFWLSRADVFRVGFVVGFFGLPVCGLIWWLWLMTGAASRPHGRAFLWGMPLGGFLGLLELFLVEGWPDSFRTSPQTFLLVFCAVPIGNLLAVAALTALKATRWVAIGLIGGFLCLVILDGCLLALWMSF